MVRKPVFSHGPSQVESGERQQNEVSSEMKPKEIYENSSIAKSKAHKDYLNAWYSTVVVEKSLLRNGLEKKQYTHVTKDRANQCNSN